MALFREAVGDVRSVENDRVAPPEPRQHVPTKHSREADDRSVMDSLLDELSEADLLETGEHLAYTQAGVQRAVLRKLKSCLLYTSPSPRDQRGSRMPSSA